MIMIKAFASGIRCIRDSVVGIVTGCVLDDHGVGVRVPMGARMFTSLCHPEGHWGPHSLLSNEYLGLFSRG
jgi:hypothetical protein